METTCDNKSVAKFRTACFYHNMHVTTGRHLPVFLNRPAIEECLDRLYYTQEALADSIGISRVHFNRLLNGRHRLTRSMRQRIRTCPDLHGIPDDELWGPPPEDMA